MTKTQSDIPDQIWTLLEEVTPDDVGSDMIPGWILRFEGFSDMCMDDARERMALPKDDPRAVSSIEDVLEEVREEFRDRLGEDFIIDGVIGSDENPIVYAIGTHDPAPEP